MAPKYHLLMAATIESLLTTKSVQAKRACIAVLSATQLVACKQAVAPQSPTSVSQAAPANALSQRIPALNRFIPENYPPEQLAEIYQQLQRYNSEYQWQRDSRNNFLGPEGTYLPSQEGEALQNGMPSFDFTNLSPQDRQRLNARLSTVLKYDVNGPPQPTPAPDLDLPNEKLEVMGKPVPIPQQYQPTGASTREVSQRIQANPAAFKAQFVKPKPVVQSVLSAPAPSAAANRFGKSLIHLPAYYGIK